MWEETRSSGEGGEMGKVEEEKWSGGRRREGRREGTLSPIFFLFFVVSVYYLLKKKRNKTLQFISSQGFKFGVEVEPATLCQFPLPPI